MKAFLLLFAMILVACGADRDASDVQSDAQEPAPSMGKSDQVTQTPVEEEAEADAQTNTDAVDTDSGPDGTIVTEAEDTNEEEEYESLADSFDYCGEFELYDDGECHTFCHEPDPDCEGLPEETNACTTGDGLCREDCEGIDGDCEEEVVIEDGEWVEDAYILRVCVGLDEPEYIRDFAESLCMGSEERPTAYAMCIEACVEASLSNN